MYLENARASFADWLWSSAWTCTLSDSDGRCARYQRCAYYVLAHAPPVRTAQPATVHGPGIRRECYAGRSEQTFDISQASQFKNKN